MPGSVHEGNRYRFDQACRVQAIELASRLRGQDLPDGRLCIDFLPNAGYRPETCIRVTRFAFLTERLVFEATDGEKARDEAHLQGIFTGYRQRGFATATGVRRMRGRLFGNPAFEAIEAPARPD